MFQENPDCVTEDTDDEITDDIDDIIGGGSGCESYGPSYQSCGADGCYDPSIHVCCNDGRKFYSHPPFDFLEIC
jgi:hypothetical protein